MVSIVMLMTLLKGCKSPAFQKTHESPPPAFRVSPWTCADGRRTRIEHDRLVHSLLKGYAEHAPIRAGRKPTAPDRRRPTTLPG